MTPRPLRTALIGFGMAADGFGADPLMARHFTYASHAQVLAAHPAFAWQAVVDRSEEARARARTKWSIDHLAETPEALCQSFDPEVAVIATPPRGRREIVERLPNLKAVVVEKPLGTSLPEARAFLDHCRARGILVQVNYWRRAVPGFRGLADGGLVELIGRPQAVFATYGNGLLNNGSHLVDFVRMLLGEVVSAETVGEAVGAAAASAEGDAEVPFTLRLADGAVVMAQPLDFRHYREVSLDIWGRAGRLALMQESLAVLHYPLGDNRGLAAEREVASDRPRRIPCPVDRALYEIYDNLWAAIQGTAALLSPGDSALASETVVHGLLGQAASDSPTLARAGG